MDILKRIITMDKAAASRVAVAVEKERKLSEESGEQAAKESGEMISEERKKMQAACEEQQQKLDRKLKEAEKIREERCAELDEVFNSKREQWKSEILDRITGV